MAVIDGRGKRNEISFTPALKDGRYMEKDMTGLVDFKNKEEEHQSCQPVLTEQSPKERQSFSDGATVQSRVHDDALVVETAGNHQASAAPTTSALGKSSTVFRDEEVHEMVSELQELMKKCPEQLKSLVFSKSNFAMAVVTSKGCRITFSNGTVYLDVPPNDVKEDQILFIYRPIHIHFAGTTPEDTGPPPDFIVYAPTVQCGPAGTKLDIPATLQFGHCAIFDATKGPTGLFAMKRINETSPWEAMEPDEFDIDSKFVKARLTELSDCTLGFPYKREK